MASPTNSIAGRSKCAALRDRECFGRHTYFIWTPLLCLCLSSDAQSESLQRPGRLSYNGRSMNAPSTITASLRDTVRCELAAVVGSDWVLDTPDELIVYECD